MESVTESNDTALKQDMKAGALEKMGPIHDVQIVNSGKVSNLLLAEIKGDAKQNERAGTEEKLNQSDADSQNFELINFPLQNAEQGSVEDAGDNQ